MSSKKKKKSLFSSSGSGVGIDISDTTIEVVEVVARKGKVKVVSMGRESLPSGVVRNGRIKDKERLKGVVQGVMERAKPKPIKARKVVFALPESQVYVHIFELQPHEKGERDALLLKEAQVSFPMKEEDLEFTHSVLHEEEDGSAEILLVGVSREVLTEWHLFFQEAGLDVEEFDLESLATFRGLFLTRPESPVCVVDIGAVTSTIAIFNKEGLRFSYTVDAAGNTLTSELAAVLKISKREAEEKKISVGLSDKNDRTFLILLNVLQPLLQAVKANVGFFRQRHGQEIESIVLVGGTSKLKGLVKYFREELDLPVLIGESVLLKSRASLEYIEATGLALRGVGRVIPGDPVIRVKKSLAKKAQGKRGSESEPLPEATPKKLPPANPLELKRKRSYRSKAMLFIVLAFGIDVILLAGRFRDSEREKRQDVMTSGIVQYAHLQTFRLVVPVSSSPEKYSADRVKGRIIEDTIEGVEDQNAAVAQSRLNIEQEVQKGERLWPSPISQVSEQVTASEEGEPDEGEGTSSTLIVRWLVYDDAEANRLFEEEVEILSGETVSYALSNIKKVGLQMTPDPQIFYLNGTVTIATNKFIDVWDE